MREWLQELKKRNALLFGFGWLCMIGCMGCCLMLLAGNAPGAWIRPARFLAETTVFVWTIGWLMDYLHRKQSIQWFSWVLGVILLFEDGYTIVFALHEELTHTVIDQQLNELLMTIMALGVAVISLYIAYFMWLFFVLPLPHIRRHYLWGIRLGLLGFVLFSISGNLMTALPGWNIGSPDGRSGLPFVNWKQQSSELRLAHFLGMHALQVLPLVGCYIARRSILTILFSVLYFLAVIAIFTQALLHQPLIELYFG
ncbi:hypothetical protein [Sediminibacterium soli]|uniref:hypothetical protein n=1 Tax=Sediminibacterium soli TaxID=2698829 RepID=UPI001379970F|nr:hypothetical protein [Sediminibacterium soli]NCI46636.1 hypothetical protein [Sediminibacterium soli]